MRTRLLALLILAFAPAASAYGIAPQSGDQIMPPEEITAELTRSVELGLEYLASQQDPSGAWYGDVGYKLNQNFNVVEENVPHVGVTALAGMAFLAGGHLPDRGRYGPNLQKAIQYLLDQVNDLGFICAHQTRMYSHAFATLFLAEVYGMTSNEQVRTKLQQAVDLIVASQNERGSWRYAPFAVESDMSITVCQLMALRAARNIGIKVNLSTIDRAVKYVRGSMVTHENYDFRWDRGGEHHYYASGVGAFRYQDENDARSSFALTAAGVTSLYHASYYDTRGLGLEDSLKFMSDQQRQVSKYWQGHYFYYYGHYYAVQAFFITGGDWWKNYWKSVSRELLDSQASDGHWENETGPGPNFGTAVALIVLQTPYKYLPILQR